MEWEIGQLISSDSSGVDTKECLSRKGPQLQGCHCLAGEETATNASHGMAPG